MGYERDIYMPLASVLGPVYLMNSAFYVIMCICIVAIAVKCNYRYTFLGSLSYFARKIQYHSLEERNMTWLSLIQKLYRS